MKLFHYLVQSTEGGINEIVEAKNRVSADLKFSSIHPDITPSVVEITATQAKKLKKAFKQK